MSKTTRTKKQINKDIRAKLDAMANEGVKAPTFGTFGPTRRRKACKPQIKTGATEKGKARPAHINTPGFDQVIGADDRVKLKDF